MVDVHDGKRFSSALIALTQMRAQDKAAVVIRTFSRRANEWLNVLFCSYA